MLTIIKYFTRRNNSMGRNSINQVLSDIKLWNRYTASEIWVAFWRALNQNSWDSFITQIIILPCYKTNCIVPNPVFTRLKYRRNTVDPHAAAVQNVNSSTTRNPNPENAYFASYKIGNIKHSYNPSYNTIMAAWSKVTTKKLFLSKCVLGVLGSEVC